MNISLKGIIDEDFVNYKVPSMILMFPHCTFKCGADICQNSSLAKAAEYEIEIDGICKRYLNNPITRAIVCQGLEPMDSFDELCELIRNLRDSGCVDDVVIYTGYDRGEIVQYIDRLSEFQNIVVKFGRYKTGEEQHFDEVLGVKLASGNQYAERIS